MSATVSINVFFMIALLLPGEFHQAGTKQYRSPYSTGVSLVLYNSIHTVNSKKSPVI